MNWSVSWTGPLKKIRLRRENEALRRAISDRYDFSQVIGKSKAIGDILERTRKVIGARCTVLITGESGTGKELIARAIHYNGPQAAKPFVVVNCSAIPRDLLESELFGHEKGAFTGASVRKKGLFEEADGGTLFLDEIGNLPTELQAKLLRAVQDGEIRRVGGIELIKIDCRIIAATNSDLKAKVDEGQFRADLYYRLNVVPVHVPSLRERREDIPLLVQHFLGKYSAKLNRPIRGISPAALDLLMRQPWQGNVRELENIIERAVVFSTDHDLIDLEGLPASFQDDSEWFEAAIGSKLSIEAYTKALIQRCDAAHYHESDIARLLGINPKTLWEKRRRWNLHRKSKQSIPYPLKM